jgi:phosphatidate cytidylyltransferase
MDRITYERLFGYRHAFDHPVTLAIVFGVAAVLVLSPVVVQLLFRFACINEQQRTELMLRYKSWLFLIPLMFVPVLLGAAWTQVAVLVLSLLCYREFARATGLFREKLISLVVVIGIVAVMAAALDHWYDLFVALFPLVVAVLAATAILPDQPRGYIQRVALGVLAFALFGVAFGHLSYMSNDANYRPLLLMVLIAVAANDVFAYVVGKSLGRRKLAPNTSPNKTVAGAAGALLLTTGLVAVLAHFVFKDSPFDRAPVLFALGATISIVGQLGDLMLSSIKRDLGLKDTGVALPGHGGLLDRFDSLILVAPAVFHLVGYFLGFGLDQPTRIFSGG